MNETDDPQVGVPRDRPLEYLNPREILLLVYARTFTTEREHYGFWEYKYRITDVPSALDRLVERGFLDLGDHSVTLEGRTAAELKEVLSEHELKVSGKKTILVDRILEWVSDSELDERFPERWYILTDLGEKAVDENAYVSYVHRTPNLELDINQMAEMVIEHPQIRWRDLIWGHLNRQLKAHSDVFNWGLYRNVVHSMAEFMADECRWRDAIALMSEVAFFDMSGLQNNAQPARFAQYFFPYETSWVKFPPGLVQIMRGWVDRAELDEDELRPLLFERLRSTYAPFHLFTVDEVVQAILWELDGNVAALVGMYEEVERRWSERDYPIVPTREWDEFFDADD